MCHRGLLLLPVVYRAWAKYRLMCVQPWIRQWQSEHMFAGVQGRGAEDAWMESALALEEAKIAGDTATFVVADVFKAFDQVCRPLAYAALAKAGFPPCVLRCYADYLEGLTIRNKVAEGVGELTHRPFALPQGDPWSMV
eukprot:5406474-Alexandrium_andersonii.AAC.1